MSWNLTIGKNPLWVAKQYGHSIATMLRAYAAWAEETAEADVEAITRSMHASEAPPTERKRALAIRSPQRISSGANRLFRHGGLAVNQTKEKWAGAEGLHKT